MRTLIVSFIVVLASAATAFAQSYGLSAPDEVHIRQSVEVQWTAPEESGGLLEIRPVGESSGRVNYAYTQGNPQSILAPEAPGDYTIVYIYESEVRASHPLHVVMAEATVTAPATAGAGESIEVPWTGPNSRSDYLTFAERDGAPVRGQSYAYVGNLRGAPASLRAPADPGQYDVVYVTGETILARAPVEVGGIEAVLTAPAEIHAGGAVRVSWVGPENSQDLITFAARDGDRIRGASYHYVGNAGEDDSAILTASETLGLFDIVYVSNDRIIGRSPIDVVEARVEISAPDEVTAWMQFAVNWQGAGNQGDIIQMHRGEADARPATFSYVDPNEGFVTLNAPEEPGAYTLFYFTREGREMARAAITVSPPPAAPGQLLVEQTRAALSPDDAVGVILDASGSMLQRIGDERRIAIARETLTGLVSETIPTGTGFALRVFGHREADSCRTDLEVPLGPLDPAQANSVIASVNAMNLAKTPLGRSIELAASDLEGVGGQRVLIVLTDGEETCDGDAAAAIQHLRDLGWDIRVNIVGFAIDDADLEATFQSWAAIGGGTYFSAADQEELADALSRAVTGPYEIVDPETGTAIASGRPGELVTLPVGTYTIRWGAVNETTATITSGDVTHVTLQ